jgi:DNA-binding protein H-NS
MKSNPVISIAAHIRAKTHLMLICMCMHLFTAETQDRQDGAHKTSTDMIARLQNFGDAGQTIIKKAADAGREARAEAAAGGRAAKRQRQQAASPSDAKSEAGASSGDSIEVVDREASMLPETPASSVAVALEDNAAIAVDGDAAAADSDGGTASVSNADLPVAAASDSDGSNAHSLST